MVRRTAMKTKRVSVAFGKGELSFSLPAELLGGVLKNADCDAQPISTLLDRAIGRPSGGLGLSEALRGKRNILLAVTDATRKSHLDAILPTLLRKIDGAHRPVDIIVATGLHKVLRAGEKSSLLGAGTVSRYAVLEHGLRPGSLARLGKTSLGTPVTLDRAALSHDMIISVGVVEPHLYAGYSGGAKTVAIGLAGQETIDDTHGPRFLADKLTRIGSVDGNPFQDTLWEIAGRTPLGYCVNVVNDQTGQPLKIFCGRPREVFLDAVGYARRIYEVRVSSQADIAIAGIGYPKDINLYQSSRAVNYIANVSSPVVRKGGVIIVCARLDDGAGSSPSEKLFLKTLRSMGDPGRFLERARRHGCIAGEHRAFMMARPLIDYRIAFVSPGRDRIFRGTGMRCFGSVASALEYARAETGPSRTVYVIPHALATIANVDQL